MLNVYNHAALFHYVATDICICLSLYVTRVSSARTGALLIRFVLLSIRSNDVFSYSLDGEVYT